MRDTGKPWVAVPVARNLSRLYVDGAASSVLSIYSGNISPSQVSDGIED